MEVLVHCCYSPKHFPCQILNHISRVVTAVLSTAEVVSAPGVTLTGDEQKVL